MENIKELLHKELEKYKKDSSTCKPYMQSMKEITLWLQEKAK